jgi:TonB-dependent starch-binding outer membrane protein SusC
MRITCCSVRILILLTCVIHTGESFSQPVFNKGISLEMIDVPLQVLLDEIENITDIKFAYSRDFIRTYELVSLNVENKPLSDVLDKLLSPLNIEYEIFDKQIALKRKQIIPAAREPLVVESLIETFKHDRVIMPERLRRIRGSITSGNIMVGGKITDASTGEPLPGANITVIGTYAGTITDNDGKYQFSVPANAVISFSYVGYDLQKISIERKTTIDIALVKSLKALEEVVVIGYGTRNSRDVTTSISTVSSRSIERVISMTPEMAMQGQMAGVQVANVSGEPMARPNVRIRGVNTWGVSSPLYVIDGIPVTEYGGGYEGIEDARATDLRGPLNVMTTINPNDIESISVLKDASAAAIYGVRASNGVILITTKRGRMGEPSIEFSSRYGVQNIPQRIDVLNSDQYTAHVRQVLASDPTIPIDPDNEGRFDPADPRYLGNSPTYDWQDALVNRNAPTQDYSLRISGATERVDYSLSGNFADTRGPVVMTDLQRLSGALQINTRIKDWMRAGVNYRISHVEGDYGFFRPQLWERALTPPWQPIYGDGPGGYAPTVMGVLPDGTYSSARLYGQGTRQHNIAMRDLNESTYSNRRDIGSLYFEIEPLARLTVRGQISMDSYNNHRQQFGDKRASVYDYTAGDRRATGGPASVGTYAERDVENHNTVREIFVNYNNSFGDHNVDLLFSGMDQQYGGKASDKSTEYLTTRLDYLRVIGGERQYTSTFTDLYRYALQGLLGRVGYNYRYTYYLDLVMRRDGSARFAPENRWGTFPAVSAAWRITNESFMMDVSWLNDLKLRAGWGQLGNQEVRDMAYLSAISPVYPGFAWGLTPDGRGYNNTAAAIFGLANRDLQWEKTTTTNVGLDAVLFRSLSFTAEYYNKLTDGILQTVSLPNSVGVSEQPVDNIASVRNRGFEVALNYAGQVGELGFSVGGNFTLNDNQVISTYKGIPIWGTNNIEEGYPLFYVRGYKVGGIFQSQAEIDAWLAENTDNSYQVAKIGPGDFYFQDLRGGPDDNNEFYTEGPDKRIDSYDQVYLGKSIPGHYYGFNLNLTFRGLDMGAMFTGVGDVVKYNVVRQQLENTSVTDINLSLNVIDSWSPQNPNTGMPRIMRGDPAGNFRGSDYFVESAAYLRLSNLQVGYTLPQSFYAFTNGNISNLRIYIGASNLFTITPYRGLDPEFDDYPIPRILFMGLNALF